MSHSLQPQGLQHTRLPCPSLSPGVCSNSGPLSRWCHPTSSSLSPPSSGLSLSQHQGLFQWVGSSHQVAKVLEFTIVNNTVLYMWKWLREWVSNVLIINSMLILWGIEMLANFIMGIILQWTLASKQHTVDLKFLLLGFSRQVVSDFSTPWIADFTELNLHSANYTSQELAALGGEKALKEEAQQGNWKSELLLWRAALRSGFIKSSGSFYQWSGN